MQVSVRFFTILREITGKREEVLQFAPQEKVTVSLVLRKLAQTYGKDFCDYVFTKATGEVKGFLQFLVNGKSVAALGGLETQLEDGDVLAIVPPVGGG
ncbi:MAG: MoaD family protein [Candidatus Bathyarchaeota archaeon]|nr:MoaD family protein [Candidatus Bathyarchaeota archaeon]